MAHFSRPVGNHPGVLTPVRRGAATSDSRRWAIAGRLMFLGLTLVVAVGALAPCSAADLDYPLSLAVAADGTIYIGDLNMPGVRRIAGGKLTTYFQASKKFRTPLNRVRCLAIDHQGKLLAADTSTRQVYRFNADGQPEPLLTGLGIGIPMAMAVAPSGEIYVADLELHRVWKVPVAGGEATLHAEIVAPRGLFLDKEGYLWVVTHGKSAQLVRVSPDGKSVEPIVKDRIFEFQHNVVVDEEGNAYVSDGYSQSIWKVPTGEAPIKWVTGDPLVNPVGLAWKGKSLLVADPRAGTIFQIGVDKQISPVEFQADSPASP